MSHTPSDLKYTKSHEWLKESSDEIIVGITQHAQELLGDMVFVELPDIGQSFNAGDELSVVESVKAASDVYAPISGVIVAVNQQLVDKPELVNQDPYGTGWLVKMKANDPADIQALLNAEQYQTEIAKDH